MGRHEVGTQVGQYIILRPLIGAPLLIGDSPLCREGTLQHHAQAAERLGITDNTLTTYMKIY